MEKEKPRINRKKWLTVFFFLFGLTDAIGLLDIPQTGYFAIEDKYIIENYKIRNTFVHDRHYLVFRIMHHKVDTIVSRDSFEKYEQGEILKVEYKIPVNLIRKPYIDRIYPVE